MNSGSGATHWTRHYGFWVASITLLAWLLREYYVLATIIDVPIRGDVREYALYAWNLAHRGVFGMSEPGASVAVPDAYRSPGFPWILALCMRLRPEGIGWYPLALQCQVLLGATTVTALLLLARRWLTTPWAVLSGLLLTFWPHHIAASGALLSEVPFGWALVCGLWAFAAASEGSRYAAPLAGMAFGYAYLVNPLIALFPPLLAALLWRVRNRREALLFLGIFLAPLLALAARNASLAPHPGPEPSGRAVINLVQGSWPEYHQAWQAQRQGDPIAVAIMDAIDREIVTTAREPMEGARDMAHRMSRDPAYYALWYLVRKPMLLWDWNIRIGWGGPYVLQVRQSPLDRNPLLVAIGASLRAMTPLLTLSFFGAAFGLLAGGLRHRAWAPPAAVATAALAVYLTGVHDVFQAEPRYANAYRGIEVLQVATFLQVLANKVTRYVTSTSGLTQKGT